MDLGLRVVRVSGRVTARHAAIPSGAYTGTLVFREVHDGGTAIIPVTRSDFALSLAPGTYDILYVGDPTR